MRNIAISLILLAAAGCQSNSSTSSGQPAARVFSTTTQKVQFTFALASFFGENRALLAQELIPRARQVFGSQDIWLSTEAESLTVNYGHFSKAQAKKELTRIRSLYPELNLGRLQFVTIRNIPIPDPPAPAEWNLLNSRCAYTLDIASYYDVPEQDYFNRKADAVETVRRLRAGGEQAFFVHGQKESRVYVGCIGFNEVRILPPPSQINVQEQNRIVSRKIQVGSNSSDAQINPLRQQWMAKFRYHYENGEVVSDIIRNERIPRQPILLPLEAFRQGIPF